MDKDVISTKEAAAILECTRHNVVKQIKAGKILADRPGRDWLPHRESVMNYAKRRICITSADEISGANDEPTDHNPE